MAGCHYHTIPYRTYPDTACSRALPSAANESSSSSSRQLFGKDKRSMWSRNFFDFGKLGRNSAAVTGDDDDADTADETPTPPVPEAVANAQARGLVYISELPADLGPARKLLERYSGIRAKDVDEHIHAIRDKLWEIYPHVCVGHFRFLSLHFTSDPRYRDAARRLLLAPKSDGAAFLDVGCGVGQVLRQLALDGVDPRRLYGVDAEAGFVDAGYELFRDRGKLRATFVVGDLLERENHGWEALDGRMSIIFAMSFFHLFGWSAQVRAAARMVGFLRPDDPDAMIFGRHVGTNRPGDRDGARRGAGRYLHNAETWQELWDEVGELTGTRWRTEVVFLDKEDIDIGGMEGSVRRMRFAVFRA